MWLKYQKMKKIAIFASGSGTNAENLIKYFSNEMCASVSLVLTNKPDAYVIERAALYSVRCEIFDRNDLYNTERVSNILDSAKIDFVVLAGFLWLVPAKIISAYKGRIVNIHPALLPDYGGKGMYGSRVHRAVIENSESRSGITIHYVNEVYDAGDIIFQATCEITSEDNPESLAAKVHKLEYKHYPQVVKGLIQDL